MKIKLDVYLKSGAVVRAHVTDYTIKYDGNGAIKSFNLTPASNRRRAIALDVHSIDAIVRVS